NQRGQLMAGGIKAAGFRESLQPGLAALLVNAPAFAPACVGIIESLVGRAHGNFAGALRLGVKALKIFERHGVVWAFSFGRNPGIGAISVRIAERAGVAKEKQWIEWQRLAHATPVNERFFQPKEEHCRAAIEAQVSWRSLKVLRGVGQIGDEFVVGIAAVLLAILDCASVL